MLQIHAKSGFMECLLNLPLRINLTTNRNYFALILKAIILFIVILKIEKEYTEYKN